MWAPAVSLAHVTLKSSSEEAKRLWSEMLKPNNHLILNFWKVGLSCRGPGDCREYASSTVWAILIRTEFLRHRMPQSEVPLKIFSFCQESAHPSRFFNLGHYVFDKELTKSRINPRTPTESPSPLHGEHLLCSLQACNQSRLLFRTGGRRWPMRGFREDTLIVGWTPMDPRSTMQCLRLRSNMLL